MQVDFTYRPLAVHAPFHQSLAPERALFGAFGSGKSYAILAEAIAWCLEQPGIKGIVIRKTFPELRDTTVPIFKELMPADLWSACTKRSANGCLSEVVFPNGSIVYFRSMDDWNKHRSFNVGFLCYDECNEIDLESYLGMQSRVRQRELTAEARDAGYTHEITRRGIWLATNPNGKDWLYRRFAAEGEGDQTTEEYSEESAYFKSTSLDNPYLPMQFIEQLLNYPDQWVRRYVLCGFDDFAGRIYEEWNETEHYIEPLGELPTGGVLWMGMDPGTRNPTAGLWCYLDQTTQTLIGVAEYQQSYTAARKHANAWRTIEAGLLPAVVRYRVADPNINTTDRGTNTVLHDMYRREGFNFQLGARQEKYRIPALQQLVYLRRFKVTKDCPLTFQAMKDQQWEDLTPAMISKGADAPERRLKRNDHLPNCAEYLAGRWVKPAKLKLPEPDLTPWQWQSREIHRTIRKQRSRKRRRPTGLGV